MTSSSLELTFEEKSYLLSCSILFIKAFESDKRKKSYIEFAYYIILKYSTKFNDYIPLYDFSVNFGFYPIAKTIINNQLIANNSFQNCFIDFKLEDYKISDESLSYYETYEQQKSRNNIMKSTAHEISYVAPRHMEKAQ